MKVKSLSVVIAAYNARKTIERCLCALEPQVSRSVVPVEVIVVDSSTDGTAGIISARFPWVKLLTFAERKYPGDARNAGASLAVGELIAFIDADCVAYENWLAEIVKSHESESAAIGGAVDNGNPESYVGWGYYFGEFTRWAPQIPPGLMIEIPTCCLSVKRWAFERYGPFLEGVYCSDTDFNWQLDRAGYEPLFNSEIRVAHINPVNLPRFLRHEVEHGRAFAALRVRVSKFSRFRSLAYVLCAPLLPWLLFARVARRVISYKIHVRQFFFAAPLTFLGLAAWSWGETIGYAADLLSRFRSMRVGWAFRAVEY